MALMKPKKRKYKIRKAMQNVGDVIKDTGKKVRGAKATAQRKRVLRLRDVRSTGLRSGQQKRLSKATDYERAKDERILQRFEDKGNRYVKDRETVEKDTEGAEFKKTSASKRAARTLDRIDRRSQRKMKRQARKGFRRAIQDQSGPNSRNSSQGIQCGPKGCSAK